MLESGVSRTAIRIAARRAAHQILYRPPVFEDPLALAVVGTETAATEDAAEINSRYFRDRADRPSIRGRAGRLLCARV